METLAAFSGIEHSRRNDVELPLPEIQMVEGRLLLMGQQSEDIHLGLSPWFRFAGGALGVPGAGCGTDEHNRREPLLMPAPQEGGRLHFHRDPTEIHKVERCPLLPNALRHTECLGHDVVSQHAPQGVADQVGGTPLPEAEQIEAQLVASRVGKAFFSELDLGPSDPLFRRLMND